MEKAPNSPSNEAADDREAQFRTSPESAKSGRPAVFLDRDGTLIRDLHYPAEPEKVALLPGTAMALRLLQQRGFALIVVSNQSGIGRGLIAPSQAEAVHRRFTSILGEAGVHLDACYYCPHAPSESCACRKPAPEMVFRAAREQGIDLGRSVLVGDKQSDIETGRNAGVRTILLGAGNNGMPSDWEWVLDQILRPAPEEHAS